MIFADFDFLYGVRFRVSPIEIEVVETGESAAKELTDEFFNAGG